MNPELRIKETAPIDVEDGFIINGFPSTGLTSAIAAEFIINASKFEPAAIIDSDSFPPISIVKNGAPSYPTKIFVNNDLKVAIFSSYLTIDVALHRAIGKMMLNWAREKKCSTIISSVTTRSSSKEVIGVASTGKARGKLVASGINVAEHATIPGIPGVLLNEGMVNGQDVIVLLVGSESNNPDLIATSHLCDSLAKLTPGISSNLSLLEKEAKQIEEGIKQAEAESRDLSEGMYR